MKKIISFLIIINIGLFLSEKFSPIIAQNNSNQWTFYGKVYALYFRPYAWHTCIGDCCKYDYSGGINKKFFDLEDENEHLLKPINESITIYYKQFNEEKRYRMYIGGEWVYFSLNPHTTIEYIVDNNNHPTIKEKDVSNYTHFLEWGHALYFIKMY